MNKFNHRLFLAVLFLIGLMSCGSEEIPAREKDQVGEVPPKDASKDERVEDPIKEEPPVAKKILIAHLADSDSGVGKKSSSLKYLEALLAGQGFEIESFDLMAKLSPLDRQHLLIPLRAQDVAALAWPLIKNRYASRLASLGQSLAFSSVAFRWPGFRDVMAQAATAITNPLTALGNILSSTVALEQPKPSLLDLRKHVALSWESMGNDREREDLLLTLAPSLQAQLKKLAPVIKKLVKDRLTILNMTRPDVIFFCEHSGADILLSIVDEIDALAVIALRTIIAPENIAEEKKLVCRLINDKDCDDMLFSFKFEQLLP